MRHVDRSKFNDINANSDYDGFGIKSIIDGNQQILDSIIKIIKTYHEKIHTIDRQEHINLIEVIINQYPKILEKITNDEFRKKLLEKIQSALKSNIDLTKSISASERMKIGKDFKAYLDSDEFKRKIKANVDVQVENPVATTEMKNTIADIYSKILQNKNVINALNTKIVKFQKQCILNSFNGVLNSIKVFKIANADKISQVKFQTKQIEKIKDTISKTSNSLQDKFIQSSKMLFVTRYNKFIYETFKRNVSRIKGKTIEEIASNILSHDLARKIIKFFKKPKEKMMKILHNLTSKRWWKNKMKSTLRRISGFLADMIKGFYKGLFRLGKTALIFGFRLIPKTISFTINLIHSGYNLIKNLLNLSVRLIQNTITGGWQFFKKVQIFFFSPPGAYLLGYICGNIYVGIKRLFGTVVEKLSQMKDRAVEYVKNLDEELKSKHPMYSRFRMMIDEDVSKISGYIKFITDKFKEYGFDVKEMMLESDEGKRKIMQENFKQKFKTDFKIDDIKLGIFDTGLKITDGILDQLEKFENMLSDGQILNMMSVIEELFNINNTGSIYAKTASTAIIGFAPLAATLASATGLGPLGMIVGPAVVGMIASCVKFLMANVSKSPVDIGEMTNRINKHYMSGLEVSQQFMLTPEDKEFKKNKQQYDLAKNELDALREPFLRFFRSKSENDETYAKVQDALRRLQFYGSKIGAKHQVFDMFTENSAKQYQERIDELENADVGVIANIDKKTMMMIFEGKMKLKDVKPIGHLEKDQLTEAEMKRNFLLSQFKMLNSEYARGSFSKKVFFDAVNKIFEEFQDGGNIKLYKYAQDEKERGPFTLKEWREGGDNVLEDLYLKDGIGIMRYAGKLKTRKTYDYLRFEKISTLILQPYMKSAEDITDRIYNSLGQDIRQSNNELLFKRFIKSIVLYSMNPGDKNLPSDVEERIKNKTSEWARKYITEQNKKKNKDEDYKMLSEKIADTMSSAFSYLLEDITNGENIEARKEKLKDFMAKHGVPFQEENTKVMQIFNEGIDVITQKQNKQTFLEEKRGMLKEYIRNRNQEIHMNELLKILTPVQLPNPYDAQKRVVNETDVQNEQPSIIIKPKRNEYGLGSTITHGSYLLHSQMYGQNEL